MTAGELMISLRARGVELVPAGDRLRFRPGEMVTPEERATLRRYKTEILQLLASPLPETSILDPTTPPRHPWRAARSSGTRRS